MKKIWNIIIVLVLLGSLTPLALAEADEDVSYEVEIDENTKKEVAVMNNRLGSSIRLLQLEKSITRNIAKGEYIISYLKENNSVNTSELELILIELELLKDEVSSADPNASDAVTVFVDLKLDAINLTKEFRDTLHLLLGNESKIESVKANISYLKNDSVENLGQRIRKNVREYNAYKLEKIFSYINVSDSTIVDSYKNDSLNLSQVKQQIGEQIKNMTMEKRNQIFSEIKQSRIRGRIQAQMAVENITEGFHDRQVKRLENRINKAIENIPDENVRQNVEDRINEKIKPGSGKPGE